MFICENDEKIFQTLPGQGWRVLIAWDPNQADRADGFPQCTEEPVIAWVTVKVHREATGASKREYEEVVIAPLVRYPDGRGLALLADDCGECKWVYIAPGENADGHSERLLQHGYVKGLCLDQTESVR